MIQGIGHIGIYVSSIEESLTQLAKMMDFDYPDIAESAEAGMRNAVVEAGGTQIELLQEIDPNGEIARKCRDNGNIIHHFALLTDNIEDDLQNFKKKGIEMMDQSTRIGLRKKKIAMSEPSAFNGIPVELTSMMIA